MGKKRKQTYLSDILWTHFAFDLIKTNQKNKQKQNFQKSCFEKNMFYKKKKKIIEKINKKKCS